MTYAKDGGADKRCYRITCDKIMETLPAYRPQWTVRKGVEELYQAYKAVELKRDDLEGSRFLRIKHILGLLDRAEIDKNLRWL